MSKLDIDQYLADPAIYNHVTEKSPFVAKVHDEILAVDLRIIENNKLRKIIWKCPKYCQHKTINFTEAKKNVFAV